LLSAGGKQTIWKTSATPANTFFESWATQFGDYFKARAIRYAWQLLTEQYRLPPENCG